MKGEKLRRCIWFGCVPDFTLPHKGVNDVYYPCKRCGYFLKEQKGHFVSLIDSMKKAKVIGPTLEEK